MSFKNFQFHPQINTGIIACGYTTPTPIQKKAIPPVLDGHDIFGLAQTGTGKTAAFVLPLLQKLIIGPRKKPRALIVAPTRELAEQVHNNIEQMAKKTDLKSVVVYGGVSKFSQTRTIRAGVEIIVACPGRLLDLVNDKIVSLNAIEMLILDEADHMFDKGFLPDIKRIIRLLPEKRQSLVFSATMPKEIRVLVEKILRQPVTVQVEHTLPASTISHTLFKIAKEQRTALLKNLIHKHDMKSTLVFTRTKHKAKSLALQLVKSGYSATSIQGNLSQPKRQKALDGFKEGAFKILVATDIAARGIDVTGISHVINYDLPDTIETYTHRTGRTGRATKTGHAFSFFNTEDTKMVRLIERKLGKKIRMERSPEFVADAKRRVPVKKKSTPLGASKKRKPATSHNKNRCTWSKSLVLA
ncbi:MAG: DEAD/DEAH box helicase [Desulfobacula sp.]|nr:DEAD/DEAH box helicase [Desulfobacula sp.]